MMFENIVKVLLKLWQGTHKDSMANAPWVVPEATCKIDDKVQVTFNFIPSTWGRRMTHPFKQNAFLTTQDLANFLLHIGPALLHQHLPPSYYAHFLALCSICLCLTTFETPKASVAPGGSLRTDIEAWVQEYERLYYNRNPAYLPNMTSPITAFCTPATMLAGSAPSTSHGRS
ncbi:hypothetical protein JCM1840_004962 [Sporobolomyces johnsonii]